MKKILTQVGTLNLLENLVLKSNKSSNGFIKEEHDTVFLTSNLDFQRIRSRKWKKNMKQILIQLKTGTLNFLQNLVLNSNKSKYGFKTEGRGRRKKIIYSTKSNIEKFIDVYFL